MGLAKIDELDSNLNYKKLNIRISSSKSLTTPLKATNYLNPLSNVNEIYRQFTKDNLNEIYINKKKDDQKSSSIKGELSDGLNFFFVNYTSLELPDDNQLDNLINTQYPFSDVTILPFFSKIVSEFKEEDLLNNFISLTDRSLDIISTLNNKPIIGVIPAVMPRQFLKPIVKNYVDNDITSFVIDFNGRSIDSNMPWGTSLIRLMASYGLTEESFLYGINCNTGRFIKQSNEILAKDFVNMGLGIDILGINHIGPHMSSEEWRNLKSQREESLHRVFDPDNYSYIKMGDSELKHQIKGNIKNEIKKQNLELQYKESLVLQKKLRENDSLESYIESKSQVTPELIDKMKIIRHSAFDHRNYKKLDLFM